MPLLDAVAIDLHVHAQVSRSGQDPMPPELREAATRYFRRDDLTPTAQDVADYYRERGMACVIFSVDAEAASGRARTPNEEIAEVAAATPDVLIPFASIDPAKGRPGAREARRLVSYAGVRGLKFH